MLSAIVLVALTAMPSAGQQTAQEVLQLAAQKRAERMNLVKNYVIIQKAQGGMEAPFYYEEFAPEGTMVQLFRLVPMSEWKAKDPDNPMQGVSPQEMAAGMRYGIGLTTSMLGPELIGTPAGRALGPNGLDLLTSDLNKFLEATAVIREGDGKSEATTTALDGLEFASRARLAGKGTVFGGREAFRLVAENLSDLPAQQVGEATFVVDKVNVWIDTQEYVPLQLRVEGTMKNGKESAPIKLELNQLDYVQVGSMYEPRRQLMGISGLMAGAKLDPKQKKEMEKAQADMQKLKDQIAAMPASQRAMIEGQVAKAEAQLAMMTGRDVITAEVELMVYSINKGPPFKWIPFAASLEPDAPPFASGP